MYHSSKPTLLYIAAMISIDHYGSFLLFLLPSDDVLSISFNRYGSLSDSGPLFTNRTDVLPHDLVKSRSHEIGCYNDRIGMKSDRHLGSAVAEIPFTFQSDRKSLNPKLAASRLHEILREDVHLLSELRPWSLYFTSYIVAMSMK